MACRKLRLGSFLLLAVGRVASVKPMVRESFAVDVAGEVKSTGVSSLGAFEQDGAQREDGVSQKIKHARYDECGTDGWANLQKGLEERHKLIKTTKVIVEVGGNIGEDLSQFVKHFPQAQIYSLEPMPHFFETLKKKFGSNKMVTLQEIGVADKDDTLELNDHGPGTSAYDGAGSGKHVRVPIKDIDTVLSKVKESTGQIPDVVSVNCEGCEYATLKRMAEKGWIGKVPYLQMSWHIVDRVKNRVQHRCEIDGLLRKMYEPVFYSHFGWQAWKLRNA